MAIVFKQPEKRCHNCGGIIPTKKLICEFCAERAGGTLPPAKISKKRPKGPIEGQESFQAPTIKIT